MRKLITLKITFTRIKKNIMIYMMRIYSCCSPDPNNFLFFQEGTVFCSKLMSKSNLHTRVKRVSRWLFAYFCVK